MRPRDRFKSKRSVRITIATPSSVASNLLIVIFGPAGQDARKTLAAPFVLALPNGAIGGYYTLSATGLKLAEFPTDIARKLPKYPLVPATLLGRLAVDRNYRGRGYGRFLLADALFRAVRSEIASFAVIGDAKDEAARRFYQRESFLPLPEQPLKLFRPMADLAKLFKREGFGVERREEK